MQTIDTAIDAKDLEQKFLEIGQAARDTDPASFLISLDAATQSAAMHSGTRVVVAVLNSPSFSGDGEQTLQHLTEVCREHNVRVLVLDIDEGAKPVPAAALKSLVEKTGGAWAKQARDLATQVSMVASPDDEAAPAATPAPAAPAPKSAEAAPRAPGEIPFEIPVFVRFMRTSGTGATSESIADHEADFGQSFTLTNTAMGQGGPGATTIAGGGGSMEVSYWPNDPHAPLQGLVTVEAPLTALRFDVDDKDGTYQAHARITALVHDAKGAVIWTGRKDVDIRGPIAKLAARRAGSMFFMRGVTMVGQGPFTLEAKVEDLVGKTTGDIQAPVKVGRNAQGLVATDALVVRRFKGSADMFESDQVLAYEGEALSPVLNPVFPADQPIDLQIYLRLYPDLHGAPLDLSMEVQSEGKVVARLPLPFKSALSNSALQGPSNGAAGSSSILGGQAKEFPYFINLKGAKFPAGDYTGIISIHQGKNVIKRVVSFKVVGDRSKAPVKIATGPDAGAAAAEEAELAAVVLPEIEPATVDSTGLKLRDDDAKQLWDAAAKNAMGYLSQLPNFQCVQETHRFTAPAKNPNQLKEADSYQDELIFEGGKERYQRLETNGVKVEVAPVETTGVSSRNEFGSLLRGLFDPDVAATYHWAGRSMALGTLCQVFEFEVSRAKSNFVLHYGTSVASVAYTGRVFIDESTGLVRRLTIQGTGLAKEFALQSPALSLDYGMVKIGEKDYLLPLRSSLQLRQSKVFVRNEAVFRGYKKWQAESEIKFAK